MTGAPPLSDAFDRVMRWGQLTLVEDDPGKYDRDFWLDYFRRIGAQGVCLSAGGCVAFYPTRIPLHHRSAFLGSSDPFGELVNGCRKMAMTVLARIDPHALHDDAAQAHHEWVALDATGGKQRHWASPEMWVACTLGSYSFEFMTDVIREIVTMYRVDGIFANRWEGSGPCYCDYCRAAFWSACGREIPRKPGEAAWRDYSDWRESRFFELWELWDAEIRRISSAARYIPNTGGGSFASLDMKRGGNLAPMLVADRQARAGPTPAWIMGKHAKEYRACAGTKPVAGLFNVGLEERYRWKDSVNSEAEMRLWSAEAIANGMRPWMCKFSGTLHDKRWLNPVERIFRWHAKHEKYLRNTQSLARVGVVFSQANARRYPANGRDLVEGPLNGVSQALIESRIPFEMLRADRLTEDARAFRVLILPNIAVLSDEECGQLRGFVGNGGGLVATLETSLYDMAGSRRARFGIDSLLGVLPTGEVEGPMQNSYLKLNPDPKTGHCHPVLEGFEDAGRIINGVWRLPVKPEEPLGPVPLTLVPSYPDLPMEKVYPRESEGAAPELILRERGPGRVAYVPWDLGRTYWEVGCVDHGLLVRNLVNWAAGDEKPPVKVKGPGLVDVTIWRQANSMTVHLVNLNNPNAMRGPCRELIPSGPFEVRVRVPSELKAGRVRLLRAGKAPAVRKDGRELIVRLASILAHEAVAIDFA